MPKVVYYLTEYEPGERNLRDCFWDGVWENKANAQAEADKRNAGIAARNQVKIDASLERLRSAYATAAKRFDALVARGLNTPSDAPIAPTRENAIAALDRWNRPDRENVWSVDEIEVND